MTTVNQLGSFGDTSGSSLMFRNKLINGGFDVWQRGTTQTLGGYGSDDRWFNGNSGSTKTASQQTFTLGQTDVSGNPRFFSRTIASSVAGASNYVLKSQKIESVATLAGQVATLSFWAKANAVKNIAVEFVQNFGTGGSPSSSVDSIGVTTVALTTTWQRYTVTVTVPNISGKTLGTSNDDNLQVIWWFEAGSTFNARTNSLGQQSGTFDIANVQLEAGPVATPFEQRPVGMELALCQRYFQLRTTSNSLDCMAFGNSTPANNARLLFPTPVAFRSTPNIVTTGTYSFRSGGDTVINSYSVLTSDNCSVLVIGNATTLANGLAGTLISTAASGTIAFSAEL